MLAPMIARLTRRTVLGGAAAAMIRTQTHAQTDLAARVDAAVREGLHPNLHGIVVLRERQIALERYYTGVDERWGEPLGLVAFAPDVLHDMRSVTKSIVGLLYGIALAAGKVPAPEEKLLAQFPEYPDLAADPQRAALTIGHALTMTLGIEWNEQLPYTDPNNGEIAMEFAADRYRFILERPIVAPPGTRWGYCGGATALLGRLIAKGTGLSLPDYARAALFSPLGLGATHWVHGPDGTPSAASGLRMTPRDLARIGQLILDGGEADGSRVVPAAWLAQSFAPHATVGGPVRYGYQWYLGAFATGSPPRDATWIGAFGNGGQRLYVFPALKLAVAITAGNYNQPGGERPSQALVQQIILSSLRAP